MPDLESALNVAGPSLGITVSTLTFLGIPLAEWVFIGTALLLAVNLFNALPKFIKTWKYLLAKSKRRK